MELERFSKKQLRAMTWWMPRSPDRGYEAIVCDGAVRSGKTLCMGVGYFLWAMSCFDGRQFGLCGKTVEGLRRNLLAELVPLLEAVGMQMTVRASEHRMTVRFAGHENRFYIFGGYDERAAGLIQGITFAGILIDEVVLMPRSFVEQACARCSVTGSRLWFSCNPEGPQHWFYREWVLRAEEKNCLHLHFTMEDNPSLTPEIRRRYRRLYSGVFYRRFVMGLWTAAEGRVYDFFDAAKAPPVPAGQWERWYISCDYGTVNPASFGLWGRMNGVWYRTAEFYFDSRTEGRQMTDAEYGGELSRNAAARGVERAQGGQRCAVGHPADGGRAQEREDRDLRPVRGLPAGDGPVCMGPEGGTRSGKEGARPRDGRYAVFCDGRSGRARRRVRRAGGGARRRMR